MMTLEWVEALVGALLTAYLDDATCVSEATLPK
jgi:hypothetical protein